MKRRSFLDWFLTASGVGWFCSIVYPVSRYVIPPERAEPEITSLKIGSVNDVALGEEVRFRFGAKPALLIRGPDGAFAAFIAVCTHLDCSVQYRSDVGQIWCACHNGKYDLTGRNLSGPPPRPLDRLVVTVKDDDLYVSRPA